MVYLKNSRLIGQVAALYPAKESLSVQPADGYDAVAAARVSPQFTQILHDTNN